MQNPDQQNIFSVSQLNACARSALEESLQQAWIIGEISNLACPSSGHLYFSLKDERAQVRCAFFKGSQRRLDFDLENGQQILVHARVSLYEARGDYQLIINQAQLAGSGALQIAFERLKNKLDKAGLFADAHKLELPELPQQIGVITSDTGAALQDILRVLKRRFAYIPVIIYPTQVQGETAAAQIVKRIKQADQRQECDVLILARGGGSLEDLWAFNEEIVAHAIYASKIPIVTGIGHEVDFTIADLVADLRAATPSAAAECASPDQTEWLEDCTAIFNRLKQLIHYQLKHATTHLTQLQKRLRHPGQRLQEQAQHLDQLEQNLKRVWQTLLLKKHAKLEQLSRALNAVSPLNTLSRGYAILTDEKNKIIQQKSGLKIGQKLNAKIADAELTCEIVKIK
ncbi:MAG: exodeoxyribonuclease VII large subunit [Gammaproteobacteria bacterium]|nr:exodeoxyribonuclease VII large subunit [Gammaproteobacteria bacterium]